MKILLLGADGQLGAHLRGALATVGNVRASSRTANDRALRCDLSDALAVEALLRRERADLVVNAAAYTAVDQAENDEKAAVSINTELPGLIGATTAAWDGAVIHFSTDYVFDGALRRPYNEDDRTAPLGVYGRSKREGESALAGTDVDHIVLRTAWLYSLRGRNFLTTMLRLGAERERLTVVADQHGTPTSAGFIADATAHIATAWMTSGRPRHEKSGIYHLTATGETTWHGFAEAIFDEAVACGRMSHPPTVVPIGTVDYPTPAKRPAWSVLDTTRVNAAFGIAPPEWRTDLHRVMSGCYETESSA